MKPPERIETDRLILRKPHIEDAPHIFASYARDPEVTRYLTWCPHKSVEETSRIVEGMLEHWKTGTIYPFAVVLKASNMLMGMIAMHHEGLRVAIGYVLARSYWGNGYMPEAARAVIDWALQQPSIYRVYATADVENIASHRVLEKVGMQCEGLLRKYIVHPNVSDVPRDSYIFAITK